MECTIWLETILQQHITGNSVSRIINVNVEDLLSEGEFYCSDISVIKLEVMMKNGQKFKISLIKKKSKNLREENDLQGFPLFVNEIKVYTTVFKQFDQLMNNHQDYDDKLWCDMIGYKPYTAILLENLKTQNYKLADRKKFLDLNHVQLIVHSLGKFHAMGHVLIKKGLLSKADFPYHIIQTGNIIVMVGSAELEIIRGNIIVVNMFEKGIKQFADIIERHWPIEWKDIAKRLSKQEVLKKLTEILATNDDTFLTLCHGDCWTCNLMFKYCPYDENIPIALKFLDFQVTHINSYIFDVLHFLHVNVNPDIRRKKLDLLLSIYHRSLKSTLAKYGMEERTPTMQHIHAEVERVQYYCFVMNMLFMPATITDVNGCFAINKLHENCIDGVVYKPEVFKSDKCREIMGPEIHYWSKMGMF